MHGSLAIVVCFQVEFPAKSPSLIQRSPTEYVYVTKCDEVKQLPCTPDEKFEVRLKKKERNSLGDKFP